MENILFFSPCVSGLDYKLLEEFLSFYLQCLVQFLEHSRFLINAC